MNLEDIVLCLFLLLAGGVYLLRGLISKIGEKKGTERWRIARLNSDGTWSTLKTIDGCYSEAVLQISEFRRQDGHNSFIYSAVKETP